MAQRFPSESVELPHWTEPPTGEVPEVLARGRPEERSAGGGSPGARTWRDEERDWDNASFEPASLANEETRVGALVEEDRNPLEAYSFDDLDAQAKRSRAAMVPGLRAAREARMARQSREAGRAGAGGATRARRGTGATRSENAPSPQSPTDAAAEVAETTSEAGTDGRSATESPAPGRRGRRAGTDRTGGAGPEGRDLLTAVSSGLAFGILTIILFKLGSTTALLLCSAIVALATLELFGVMRRAGYRPATLVGLVGGVGLMVGAYLRGPAAYPVVLGLVVVFSLLWYLLGVERTDPVVNVGVSLLGFAWVGVLGSFAGLMLDPRLFPDRHGVAFVFGAVIVTVAYDIGAFAIGSRWGRHPMSPTVSPAKTWEGLAGGTVAAIVVAALVVSQIHPWSLPRAIALGVVVAVLAPLGDLCESLFKRDLGLKDMGTIVPGHGGLFDRVDSLLFVLPATYFLLRLLNVA
ncbi:MAG: phosphatidate cytidylyltransferase [Acidimicrobiales bacterium]|nr:phosphatidate cytidylyltransferase [Acidimicrobiales bacterium]